MHSDIVNYFYCDMYAEHNELKRQRDRERYSENREEIIKRRREAYKQKKTIAATQLKSITCGDGVVPNSVHSHRITLEDNMDIDEDNESNWLRRNDSYQMQHISRQRRAVIIPSGHDTQKSSCIIKDGTQGKFFQT